MLDVLTQSEILATSPFVEGRHDWPEGASYRYDRTGHEILRVVRGIKAEFAVAVAQGPVDLALIVDGPLIVMCSRIGNSLPWTGAWFHWHRVPRSDRILPPSRLDTSMGWRIDLILLDGHCGRVRAVRSLALPTDFARVLHEAILDQARSSYDPGEERRAMEALLSRCPIPGTLVGHATARATLGR